MTVLTKEVPANHVPAAAVKHEVRALFVLTGRKAHEGSNLSFL
jgi:hypothetical protein